MPITMQEIKDDYDKYLIDDLSSMPTEFYKGALADGAFFWIEHHDLSAVHFQKIFLQPIANSLAC